MPLKIRPECRHCGQPIQQDAPFAPWYHSSGHDNTLESRRCERFNPDSTLALPKTEVVKRGQE